MNDTRDIVIRTEQKIGGHITEDVRIHNALTSSGYTTPASSAALNFSTTLAYTPTCIISDSNTSAVADISSITSSALTVSLASALSAVKIYYICTP